MNAHTKITPVITGTRSLVTVIDDAQKRLGISDQDLRRRAGLSQNALLYLRKENQDTFVSTAAALLNELGYDLAAVPSGKAVLEPALTVTLKELRCKLRDLRTSVANRRHPADLQHEIDDILFWLESAK